MGIPLGVRWNLILAVIPAILGYVVAWGLSGKGKQKRLPLLITIPLAIAWLVFLPNTCYLLTEWRHLLFDAHWAGLLDAAGQDPRAMLSVAKWGIFFLAYSGAGVLLFAIAIRPMERWLRTTGQPFYLYAPFLFFLASLGVYLGLLPRLNSWNILTDPWAILPRIATAFTNITLLQAIVVFAILLWATYEAVDLWMDGIAERLSRWGITGKGSTSAA
jgi:uncharacterized membrane protein